MAFRDVMSSYINSLAPRGGAGRTTITGMGRDSGAKYRAMMAGMQEQARQKQQMERRLMPSTPMQQAPTQPVQQAPPVVAPPSGAAAPTAGGGPTNWQRAFPRMQGMGIGMIQGAQVSPYNRAPNWATSLAGGFQGAEQYGQAADARALEGAQEDRTTSLRAQIAQILRSETELTVEDIQEMVALAMEAKDVPLAQNLIRLLQDTQDRASGAGTATATPQAAKPGYAQGPDGNWIPATVRENPDRTGFDYLDTNTNAWLPGGRLNDPDEVDDVVGGGPDAPTPGYAPDGTPATVRVNAGVFEHTTDGINWQPGGRLHEPEEEGGDRSGTPEMIGKAQMFLTTSGNALNVLNTDLGDYTVKEAGLNWLAERGWPLISDSAYSKLSDDDQVMLGAVGQLAEAWLRLTTGAAYNREEKRDAMNNFLMRPGMGNSRKAQIRRNRSNLQTALATMAGGGDPCSVDSSFCPNPNNPMGPDGKHLSNWEASFMTDDIIGDQNAMFMQSQPAAGAPRRATRSGSSKESLSARRARLGGG